MALDDYLKDWILDDAVSNENRTVDITVNFEYPDVKAYIDLPPKDRLKKIDLYYRDQLKDLLSRNLFSSYEINYLKKRRPTALKTTVPFDQLKQVEVIALPYSVSINKISDAVLKKSNINLDDRFYCVRMTVVIDIEGLDTKMEDIEERFVIVKAISFEDAYEKVELQKETYATPYLNPDGRLVRWRIESYDDCFSTDAFAIADFDNPEGVEVYSKLKSRKRKSVDIWNGKTP